MNVHFTGSRNDKSKWQYRLQDFKISLISFYCPVLHIAVWIFIEIFQLNDFKFVLHSKWFVSSTKKSLRKGNYRASSFIFSIIVLIRFFTVWKFTCINAFSFSNFSDSRRFLQWNKSNWFCVNRRKITFVVFVRLAGFA